MKHTVSSSVSAQITVTSQSNTYSFNQENTRNTEPHANTTDNLYKGGKRGSSQGYFFSRESEEIKPYQLKAECENALLFCKIYTTRRHLLELVNSSHLISTYWIQSTFHVSWG